ncbi:MAG: internal scaffolding protein [Microvirus sp.]|nr:MAG: internal scaffolding protein [Microvirus sp.]
MTNYKPPVFRSAVSHCPDEHSARHVSINEEPSLTQQHFAQEVDINFIMAQYVNRGEVMAPVTPPGYGDFSDMPRTLQEAHNQIIQGREAFNSLNPDIRAHFGNDAHRFHTWISSNPPESDFIAVGLKKAAPAAVVPEPIKVQVVTPAPAGVVSPKSGDSKGGAQSPT